MLKKLAKRIEKELAQAEDYTSQAFIVMAECPETADLFVTLATEETQHAEKLLKEGQRIIDSKKIKHYASSTESEEPTHDECKIMWKWEHRVAMERIMEIRFRLSQYRTR